jgi:hypothetical protein
MISNSTTFIASNAPTLTGVIRKPTDFLMVVLPASFILGIKPYFTKWQY